ncbi:MAG: hypothetical protein NZ929_05445 [Aigarchaeota archaeon]|nr:hypothetical protein [Aigarchaeota archaeon]MCX8193341.1 hypothetical protein [Nitrososphaeria archaeon]MDW7985871.1 hypothetical protein [Nitrososphaerota archaeon]
MPTILYYSREGHGEVEIEKKIDCPVCKGDYKNCRLERCPYLKDVRELLSKIVKTKTIYGSSPPSALVGSHGYPRVSLGPLVPPFIDDTSLIEKHEEWLDIPLEKILSMRLSLVYGRTHVKVYEAKSPDRLIQNIQEVAMACKPVNLEMILHKEPKINPNFSVRTTPSGPIANLEKISIAENPVTFKVVEDVVDDVDLKAGEAILKLYSSGVPDYNIVRLLSVGLLGTKAWRKIVPTEWSITAVDDVLGRRFREHVKKNEWVTEYAVYSYKAHYNKVAILMMPGPWGFEVIEAWRKFNQIKVYTDSELPRESDRYPENVGGAYHAIRFPILEKLYRDRKQALVFVVAEVDEGWIPLGVWRFREICRRALRYAPRKFSTLNEALDEISMIVDTPIKILAQNSRIIKFHKLQEKITQFIER